MNRQVAEHPSVLVVDDDMRTAICVRDCLKATGFRADAVYNAGLGLELSAREGPARYRPAISVRSRPLL